MLFEELGPPDNVYFAPLDFRFYPLYAVFPNTAAGIIIQRIFLHGTSKLLNFRSAHSYTLYQSVLCVWTKIWVTAAFGKPDGFEIVNRTHPVQIQVRTQRF